MERKATSRHVFFRMVREVELSRDWFGKPVFLRMVGEKISPAQNGGKKLIFRAFIRKNPKDARKCYTVATKKLQTSVCFYCCEREKRVSSNTNLAE